MVRKHRGRESSMPSTWKVHGSDPKRKPATISMTWSHVSWTEVRAYDNGRFIYVVQIG